MNTLPHLTIRFVKWVGLRNLAILSLLAICMISLAHAMSDAYSWINYRSLILVIIAGLFIGQYLTTKCSTGWVTSLLAIVISSLITILGIGRLLKPILNFTLALIEYIIKIFQLEYLKIEFVQEIDTSAVRGDWYYFTNAVDTLINRLVNRASTIFNGQPKYDHLVDLIFVGLLCSLLSIWAVWWVRRRNNVLLALLPSGIIATLILLNSNVPFRLIIIWIGTVLLLQTLISYSVWRHRWHTSGADMADIEGDWATIVVILTSVILGLSLILPTLSFERIIDQIDRLFSKQGYSINLGRENQSSIFDDSIGFDTQNKLSSFQSLPNERLLGSGPELSEQEVMRISLLGYKPVPAELIGYQPENIPPNYYWRSSVYTNYTGRGWLSPANQTTRVSPPNPIITPTQEQEMGENKTIHQRVQTATGKGGILYSSGEPITATVTIEAIWLGTGELFGAKVIEGDYLVASQIPKTSPDQLRTTGDDYPPWILDNYIRLPNSLPLRVRNLAFDLTSTQSNTYDKVLAIQSYLRTIPYSLDIPAPPANRDLVDFFLFDLRKGFCDYYASAMVVLARSAGIPARLVVGYASGTYSSAQAKYIVTAADAHAWAEVYFPGYGWIEFEPTSARPLLNRFDEREPQETDIITFVHAPERKTIPVNILNLSMWILAGIFLTCAILLGYSFLDSWRLSSINPKTTILSIFTRFYKLWKNKVGKIPDGKTPKEIVSDLNQHIYESLPKRRSPETVKKIEGNLRQLGDLYSQAIYSQQQPGEKEQTEAIEIWKNMRRYLLRFLLKSHK